MYIDKGTIKDLAQELDAHPIYESINTLEDLQCFMQHHVYSVWDFMSLIKYLQGVLAPSNYPWTPVGDADVRRFINELVLEEESDTTPDGTGHTSHFELYQKAMQEIGADTSAIKGFIETLSLSSLNKALSLEFIPKASAKFTRTTFDFIESKKSHCVASALALGREHIIPNMFRAVLSKINVGEDKAPIFHYYLNRHVHLDEDFHAPLSLKLLNNLCDTKLKKFEAIDAAKLAIEARLEFWDGVLLEINTNKRT